MIPLPLRVALGTYQFGVAVWFLYWDYDTLFAPTTEDLSHRLLSLTLIGLALTAGFLLFRNPLLGRTFTVLHYLPQLLGIASPSFTFNAHHGVSVIAGLSGTPRTGGPGTGTFRAHASTSWGDTIELAINDSHPNHVGYLVSLNIFAAILILLALFCRQKPTQKAP